MEAVGVFVAGVFARTVADGLVLLTPGRQARVAVILIRINL